MGFLVVFYGENAIIGPCNWSTDTTELRKNKEAYSIWQLEQASAQKMDYRRFS